VVNIVCAKSPHRKVPAIRRVESYTVNPYREKFVWTCSACGARVKVVA
jgi:hypothetical protein